MPPLSLRLLVALLARAGVSQAAFARLSGLSARQVNNWCRGRAAVPAWAATLAVLLEHHSPESIDIMVEEAATEIQDAPGPLQWEDARLGPSSPERHSQKPLR